jgi:phage terminase large subunit-like protein
MAKTTPLNGAKLYGKLGWEKAQDACLWIEECLGYKPYDWQRESILHPIFGTLDRQGFRRFSTAYIEIPKKNGKSLIGAWIALLMLCGDGEQDAHVVSAAADKEQAKIVFGAAKKMVERSEILSKLCTPYRDKILGPHGGVYEAISAEAFTKHGPSYSGIIFDEVHAQPHRELWDTITPGIMARDQGLVFAITTAGHDKTSLCWELHERAEKAMLRPGLDPTFYGKIWSADPAFAWNTEEAFASCNPSYGKAIRKKAWESLIAKARLNPLNEASYRQLHLNEWANVATKWISPEVWALCA